jgi:hypothetical protein
MKMAMFADTISASLAGRLYAESFNCSFDDLAVSFAIGRNQFVNPHHPNDPPHNKVTQVVAGDNTFAAEPFIMATDVRRFYAKDTGAMLTVQLNGAAKYFITCQSLTGTCEEQ